MPDVMTCPNCLCRSVETFYTAEPVPVHSVILVPSREAALLFPAGRIALGFCLGCGFVTNTAFDKSRMSYSPHCEDTQAFSETFQLFQRRLASDLVRECSLRNKTVLEIGCGKGDFIALLCSMCGARGIGFDPAYEPSRAPKESGTSVTFYQDVYSEKYAHIRADCIVCKMTLEHIPSTLDFLRMIRRAIGNNLATTVFIQVPDMGRVLREFAFWDIYHEHCSYFTAGALRNLFRSAGFGIVRIWRDYGDQYLMVTARAVPPLLQWRGMPTPPTEREVDMIHRFSTECRHRIDAWLDVIRDLHREKKRAVIWGSGSKGVAFLSAINAPGRDGTITCVVDVNPYRKGFYMPGTGQEIVEPVFLAQHRPDVVIAMNAIYAGEIRAELHRLGVNATVLTVEAPGDTHLVA